MRVFVTGAGSIAKRHVHNLVLLAAPCRIVVLTSQPENRFGNWSIDPSILDVVNSFDEGLAQAPDAVIIASASSMHGRELNAVLERGLPVLVEKPLLTAWQDWDNIASRLDHAHAASVLGCNLRYLPALHQLRESLACGIAGRIVRAHLEVGQWLPDWRPTRDFTQSYSANPAAGGGVVFDLVHEIDMALWLMGDLQLVAARGGHLSNLPIAACDTAVALLESQDGTPVTVSLDYVSRAPARRYVFVGDLGTLVFDLQAKNLALHNADGIRALCTDPADFDMSATYQAEMAEWLRAIQGVSPISVSPLIEGRRATRLMLDIHSALQRNFLVNGSAA